MKGTKHGLREPWGTLIWYLGARLTKDLKKFVTFKVLANRFNPSALVRERSSGGGGGGGKKIHLLRNFPPKKPRGSAQALRSTMAGFAKGRIKKLTKANRKGWTPNGVSKMHHERALKERGNLIRVAGPRGHLKTRGGFEITQVKAKRDNMLSGLKSDD